MSTIRKYYDADALLSFSSTPSPEAKGLPQKEELLNLLRVGKDTAINIPDPFAGVSIPNHISDIPPEAKGTAMQIDPRDKDYYLREYEILRQVTNIKDAIWQIVQMAQSEYKDEPEF